MELFLFASRLTRSWSAVMLHRTLVQGRSCGLRGTVNWVLPYRHCHDKSLSRQHKLTLQPCTHSFLPPGCHCISRYGLLDALGLHELENFVVFLKNHEICQLDPFTSLPLQFWILVCDKAPTSKHWETSYHYSLQCRAYSHPVQHPTEMPRKAIRPALKAQSCMPGS